MEALRQQRQQTTLEAFLQRRRSLHTRHSPLQGPATTSLGSLRPFLRVTAPAAHELLARPASTGAAARSVHRHLSSNASDTSRHAGLRPWISLYLAKTSLEPRSSRLQHWTMTSMTSPQPQHRSQLLTRPPGKLQPALLRAQLPALHSRSGRPHRRHQPVPAQFSAPTTPAQIRASQPGDQASCQGPARPGSSLISPKAQARQSAPREHPGRQQPCNTSSARPAPFSRSRPALHPAGTQAPVPCSQPGSTPCCSRVHQTFSQQASAAQTAGLQHSRPCSRHQLSYTSLETKTTSTTLPQRQSRPSGTPPFWNSSQDPSPAAHCRLPGHSRYE